MSNADAHSTITITIKGVTQSLEEAAAKARAALGGMGVGAEGAGHALTGLGASEAKAGAEGEALAAHEKHAANEARGLAAGVKIAAESVGILGIESGESVGKIFLLRDALGELREAAGGMGAAVRRRPLSVQVAYSLYLRESRRNVDLTIDLPLKEGVTAEELATISVHVHAGLDGGNDAVTVTTPPDAVERAREWLTRFWLNLPPESDGAADG